MMTKLAERWDSGLAGALPVQIPPAADTAAGEATLEAVVAALAATPGVRSAEPLDRQVISALLEPWLGDALLGRDLPLPWLLAVSVATASPLDPKSKPLNFSH